MPSRLIRHFLYIMFFLMKIIVFLFKYHFDFRSKIYKFVRFCEWQKCEF
ncbi:MAG: hypothetical protein H6Q14_196 [Bacteroidetes bacterium]|jgi:hypothetical protein|nr:hypothetical protein [Bacteroidota bacterium]